MLSESILDTCYVLWWQCLRPSFSGLKLSDLVLTWIYRWKLEGRREGKTLLGKNKSKQPDPVWYFPALHLAQLTSEIMPDPNVGHGVIYVMMHLYACVKSTIACPVLKQEEFKIKSHCLTLSGSRASWALEVTILCTKDLASNLGCCLLASNLGCHKQSKLT